jgi:hypothetical protein
MTDYWTEKRLRQSPEAAAQVSRFVRLHSLGLSDRAVGRILGLARETVLLRRRLLGLPPNFCGRAASRSFTDRERHRALDALWARLDVQTKARALRAVDLPQPFPLDAAGAWGARRQRWN